MHRDSKERRRRMAEISEKMTRQSKHVSGDALKRFREVPYQLRYRRVRKNNGLRKRMQARKNILLHGVSEQRYMPREAQEQKIEL